MIIHSKRRPILSRSILNSSERLILAGLLGMACMASAADDKKPAPQAPRPAAQNAPAPRGPAPRQSAQPRQAEPRQAPQVQAIPRTFQNPRPRTQPQAPRTFENSSPRTEPGVNAHPWTNGPRNPTMNDSRTLQSNPGVRNPNMGGTRPGGGTPGTYGGNGFGNRNPAFRTPPPRGVNEHVTSTGSAVRFRPNGRVSDVHDVRRGVDVHQDLGGGRRVSVERHDGSRVFAERGRPGYVERGYNFHGHDFERRSYFYNGRSYDRFYRGYGYRGLHLNIYAPGFYYRPAFYGWAYSPWTRPIRFGWGWGISTPWFEFYGGYFQPYAVYPSAAFWLTDYIISQDLQEAYAANQQADEEAGSPPPPDGQPVLTPEIKQMIADEVRDQLAAERQEAQQNTQQQDVDPGSSGIARLLSDGRPHVFVAGGNLDVTDASGQECVVSDGDILQMREAPPSDATSANLVVLSSKGKPECRISLTVQVQLTDLQEMQNHMRETIDQGLQDLQAKQGTGGLPPAPPTAAGAAAPAMYASDAPPPEANPGAAIQQVDQQAEQAEKDVTAEVAQDNGQADAAPDASAPAAQPATIELGQTTDQVQAAFGAPSRIANLGTKVIYYYNGMKVIFRDGKVSDVQ